MNELVALDIAEQADAIEESLRGGGSTVAAARQLLRDSSSIRLLALGSSRHAAVYGSEIIGAALAKPVVVAPAPGWGTTEVPWGEGEVAVAVTQSGHTPALIAAVRAARSAGAPVIAVVNADDSPLHELADIVVSLGVGPERVVAATKSVTAQHLALRALGADLDPTEARAAVNAALTVDIAPAVQGACPRAVVCAGMAGEWVAAELALKFSEMLGRFVIGESLVEFLHGPLAAEGSVLALVPEGDPNLQPLRLRGGTIVGSDSGVDFEVPATGDPTLDPVVRLIVGQRVVLAWAVHLGIDADASRGLSKVTISR